MKFTATNKKLRQLLFDFNTSLIPRPDFQRRLVWTNRDKLSFIDTVLKGYPFPEIYIASGEVDTKTGQGKELLVDGQQRLTTLYQYFKGLTELVIPKGFSKYEELEEGKKKEFLEYVVVVRDLGPMDISEIRNIFQRINSTSYSLNAMEVHNARYDGAFKKLAQHLACDPFFSDHNVYTTTNVRRMKDVVFTISILITFMSSYFNRDSEIEPFLAKYNELYPQGEEIKTRFKNVINIIDDMEFDDNCRVWKKADIFTLICEIDRTLHKRNLAIDIEQVSRRLKYFYGQIQETKLTKFPDSTLELYYKASVQATNDRNNRIVRGEILQEVIDPNYKSGLILTDDTHVPDYSEIKEEMRRWFYENYEDPANLLPYESKEGGYFYLWGGPYDAREVLSDKFYDEYPDDVIEELAKELEDECWEWSAKPSPEDIDNDDIDESQEDIEPEF